MKSMPSHEHPIIYLIGYSLFPTYKNQIHIGACQVLVCPETEKRAGTRSN
jgi:hypothetical protein